MPKEDVDVDEEYLQQTRRMCAFTKLFIANADHLVLLNELDEGISRDEFMSAYTRIIPIDKSRFHFETYRVQLFQTFIPDVPRFIKDFNLEESVENLSLSPSS